MNAFSATSIALPVLGVTIGLFALIVLVLLARKVSRDSDESVWEEQNLFRDLFESQKGSREPSS
ncbi:hypothetical protein [Jiella sonneratiae]|uniref:Uncharacterized protein n=1 Tax=Jiella sonneratiae TaxID=2816856 RepID=A0ABS3J1P7_9HYPH|nr:hypothetical protein [Jiella sonneratiae]MBO0902486.1 hypothetical protein [Jiella sonneratiae]